MLPTCKYKTYRVEQTFLPFKFMLTQPDELKPPVTIFLLKILNTTTYVFYFFLRTKHCEVGMLFAANETYISKQ